MQPLVGYQRKYLRGLAHCLKPVLLIGQKGVTNSVVHSLDDALTKHELVKVKFIEGKQRDNKNRVIEILEQKTDAHMVGMIGHTAILYRPHPEEDKRKITLQHRG
ncbi:MAG: ribosome assembly RNA-binding protein YhbY [Desulfobacteraceae bacterium]|nr:ribosome assembly RNA-binding protein YhbY [Desulfobacteraceae bacterium]